MVDRAMTWAEAHPRGAPERSDGPRPARTVEISAERLAERAAETLPREIAAARNLWDAAGSAAKRCAGDWLRERQLEPFSLPDALASRVRVHAGLEFRGERVPALLLPLRAEVGDDGAPDGVAVLPLHFAAESVARIEGEGAGSRRRASPAGRAGGRAGGNRLSGCMVARRGCASRGVAATRGAGAAAVDLRRRRAGATVGAGSILTRHRPTRRGGRGRWPASATFRCSWPCDAT